MWQQPGLTFKKVTDFSDQSLELVYIPLCRARCGLVNTRLITEICNFFECQTGLLPHDFCLYWYLSSFQKSLIFKRFQNFPKCPKIVGVEIWQLINLERKWLMMSFQEYFVVFQKCVVQQF
jgi:hypothetical protein